MSTSGANPDPIDFSGILNEELKHIRYTRGNCASADERDVTTAWARCQDLQTTGLALSGGGIRSATFSLGVIQALCERGVLHQFDYLSTVSGGGYIGGWLSALIYHRSENGTSERLQKDLSPSNTPGGEPKAGEDLSIGFLREYSNYLTPKFGLFSTDTLAAIAAYLRNLGLIQSMLIFLIVLVLMLPRLLFLAAKQVGEHSTMGLIVAAVVLLAVSVVGIVLNLTKPKKDRVARTPFVLKVVILPAAAAAVLIAIAMVPGEGVLAKLSLIEWMVAGGVVFGFASAAMPARTPDAGFDPPMSPVAKQPTGAPEVAAETTESVLQPVGIMAFLTGCVTKRSGIATKTRGAAAGAERKSGLPLKMRAGNRAGIIAAGCAAGAIGGALLYLVQSCVSSFGSATREPALWFAVSIAPFLILQALAVVIVLHLGLVGRIFGYEVQEWWARYGGWLIAVTLGVGGIFSIGVYGAALVVYGADIWVAHALGPAWLLTSLWGVVKGASSKTSGGLSTFTERALSIVPYVFIVGLVVLLSFATYRLLPVAQANPSPTVGALAPGQASPQATPPKQTANFERAAGEVTTQLAQQAEYDVSIGGFKVPSLVLVFAALFLAWLAFAWRVDVNLFSLHNFYRNRLTRCYLGAPRDSIGTRVPHPFTGFDTADDIPLTGLGKRVIAGSNKTFAQRPYHIINTALNISSGENLAWQQRKAASFFFSPLYCGFQLPRTERSTQGPTANSGQGRFVRTCDYMRGKNTAGVSRDCGPMLGGAVAISGAAASPNWGFHTDPGVAFLLTLFNVRLGRWCPNPARSNEQDRSSPEFGGALYINELFGHASIASDYIYLSDGGHFDNLGVYELVRRRTRVVVACDCGEDAPLQFDDLADTIRKCSSDFGVDIVIDVDPLRHIAGDARPLCSNDHVVTGAIRYPEAKGAGGEAAAFVGKLILIKPTLTKGIFKDASDLVNYALSEPMFPQQSTLDQWFNEAQFESYRKLGYLIGSELLHRPLEKDGTTLGDLLRACTDIAAVESKSPPDRARECVAHTDANSLSAQRA